MKVPDRLVSALTMPWASLFRSRSFAFLWAATAVSQIGTQVSFLAIPLLAVEQLGATPLQMGLLQAAEWLPYLIIALPAGLISDRVDRKALMIGSDVGRAAILAWIPLAFMTTQEFTLGWLIAISALVGLLSVLFDVAYQPFLPSVVGTGDRLVDANAVLEASQSVIRLSGPALAGFVIGWLTASAAMLVNVATFVASALLLLRIAPPARGSQGEDPTLTPAQSPKLEASLAEMSRGVTFLYHHPHLRGPVAYAVIASFGWSMIEAQLVLYATTVASLEASHLGLMFSVANVGLLLGTVATPFLSRKVGPGRSLVLAAFLQGLGMALLPFARHRAVGILTAGLFLRSLGIIVFNLQHVTLRQTLTPADTLGRVTGAVRALTWGIMPLGYLAGGMLGNALGVRAPLCVGALIALLALPVLLRSPASRLRSYDAPAPPY